MARANEQVRQLCFARCLQKEVCLNVQFWPCNKSLTVAGAAPFNANTVSCPGVILKPGMLVTFNAAMHKNSAGSIPSATADF